MLRSNLGHISEMNPQYFDACWPAVPGTRLSIKTLSYRLRSSHCKDKTIWPSYLHNGELYPTRPGFHAGRPPNTADQHTSAFRDLYWRLAQSGCNQHLHIKPAAVRRQPFRSSWRHDMDAPPSLLTLYEGNPLVSSGFPSQMASDIYGAVSCFLWC